jgi:hypothetical protein
MAGDNLHQFGYLIDRHSPPRPIPLQSGREGTAMQTVTLSEAALALLRLHIEQAGIRVDDANRAAHRELAAAGILYPVSTFRRGPEAYFRFTDFGWDNRHEILGCAKESA